jgi:hypothetical protein
MQASESGWEPVVGAASAATDSSRRFGSSSSSAWRDYVDDAALSFRAWRRRHPASVPLASAIAVLLLLYVLYAAAHVDGGGVNVVAAGDGGTRVDLAAWIARPPPLKTFATRHAAFGDSLLRPCTEVPPGDVQRGRVPLLAASGEPTYMAIGDVFRLHVAAIAAKSSPIAYVSMKMLNFSVVGGESTELLASAAPCLLTLNLRGRPYEMINPLLLEDNLDAALHRHDAQREVDYTARVTDASFPAEPPREVRFPTKAAVRYRTWTAAGTAPPDVLHLDASVPCVDAGAARTCVSHADMLLAYLAVRELRGNQQ